MTILIMPESSGIAYGQQLGEDPAVDAEGARILGEAIFSASRPAPILRLAVIPFHNLIGPNPAYALGASAAQLRAIARRSQEHLARASREWARRDGEPRLVSERLNALRRSLGRVDTKTQLREACDPAFLFVSALRVERTLIGEGRLSPEARAFIEELDRQLETLEVAYPATPLTELDHARAVRIARDTLVHAHLCIPVRWAKHVMRLSRMPFDDLVQAGNEGLVQAAASYDWRHGAPFAAYAYPWVKTQMRRIDRHGDALLLPLALYAARGRVRKALEDSENIEGPREDLAATTGLRPDAIEALAASTHHVSLDDEATVRTIADAAPRPAEIVERRERTVLLGAALGQCGRQEAEVLRRHYGIGCTAMTMRELARAMGLTTQRLYQLKAAGLRQLQAPDTRSLLADYAA